MHAPADVYRLLVIGAINAINAPLYKKLNFNLLRDVAPVAGIYRVCQVMEVHPSFPTLTWPSLSRLAKAKPGRINFVSAGNGSVAHARCHFRGRICKTGRGKIGRSGASDPDGKHRHGMIACEAEKIALRRGSSQICYSKPRARSIFFRKRRQYLLAPEAGPGGFPCPAASR